MNFYPKFLENSEPFHESLDDGILRHCNPKFETTLSRKNIITSGKNLINIFHYFQPVFVPVDTSFNAPRNVLIQANVDELYQSGKPKTKALTFNP